MKQPGVCILASRWNGGLHAGVTPTLARRAWQHRNDTVPGLTEQYRVHDRAWFEPHASMASAIAREKAVKEWK